MPVLPSLPSIFRSIWSSLKLTHCHGFVGNLGLHAGFMRRQEVPQNSVTFSRRFDFVYRLSFSGNIEFDEENW